MCFSNVKSMFQLLVFFSVTSSFINFIYCDGVIDKKICASEAEADACQQLARNLEFACTPYFHNVDCLLGIESNQSHVGRITGEQALLGANLLSDDVVVLGEIRSRHPIAQTVVIVKSSIPDGFINLKDRKFCHPGFKYDKGISTLMLQEFENAIVKLNDSFCVEENATLTEKHVSSLQHFFGNSCRPGFWSQDLDLDAALKRKYDSLCTLCGSAKCDTDYLDPFKNALDCLRENDADIALTTLQDALEFFNTSLNRNKYKYLCKDGSSRSYVENCTWSTQIPDLLVAEKSVADQVKNYLLDNLNGNKIHYLLKATNSVSQKQMDQYLTRILKLRSHESILLLSSSIYQSLREYVQGRRDIPTVEKSKQCDRTLKWCTYTDAAYQKCRWLSQASMNWGIQPVVECVRTVGDSELSCLDNVKKSNADIVVASSDYAYIALYKGLKTIAYPETDTRFLSTVLVVKRVNDSSIKSLTDLKGKGACVPRFGGKEHLAFIDTLRAQNAVDDTNCDYGNLLSDFIERSCVPGIRSNLVNELTEFVDKDKLCALCHSINVSTTATYCNDDIRNKYYGSEGALKCLFDQAADFAVISKTDVENGTDSKYYQVICKNGTLASRPGLQVDDDCALDVIATSEVMSKADNPRNLDIIMALEEFEMWFGKNLEKPFHLFDRFNGTLDLLFRDSTPGLSFSGKLPYMENYQKLLERAKDCKDKNSVSMTTASIFASIVSIIIVFFNCYL